MPRIPEFESQAKMTGEGVGIEAPMEANSLPAKAMIEGGTELSNMGYRMSVIAAHQRALEEKAKDTVDALKLEYEFRNEADAHAESLKNVNDVDEIDKMTQDFVKRQADKYENLQVKNHVKRAVLPSVLNSRLGVEKIARDKRATVIVGQGQQMWEQMKIDAEKNARAASEEELPSIMAELEQKGVELVNSNIKHGADVVKELQQWKQGVQFNRAVDRIDLNPDKYLNTPNRIEEYGLDSLDGNHLRQLDSYALNRRDYNVHLQEKMVKTAQDKNAELVYDKFKQFKDGKIGLKDFEMVMTQMRIPDESGNYPMRRELSEHFDSLVDNFLRTGNSVAPNPILYNKLNERLTDPINPLTYKELDGYAKELPSAAFQHFSNKITELDIATGRRGASTEKVKFEKLRKDIEVEEKQYLKDSCKDKSTDPNEMWRLNRDIENVIETSLNKGIKDRELIHKEVEKLVEPKVRSWVSKVFRSILGLNEREGTPEELKDVIQTPTIGKDMGTTIPSSEKVLKPGEAAEIFSTEEMKTFTLDQMSKRLQSALKMGKSDADKLAADMRNNLGTEAPPDELPAGWTKNKKGEVFNDKGKKMIWRNK